MSFEEEATALLRRVAPHLPFPATAEPALPANASGATLALWQQYAVLYELQVQASPLAASQLGDYRLNHMLPDHSRDAYDATHRAYVQLKEIVQATPMNALPDSEHDNYRLLVANIDNEIMMTQAWHYTMPVNHKSGHLVDFLQLPEIHPFLSAKDCSDYVARLRAFPTLLAQVQAAMQAGVQQGTTIPAFSTELVLKQLRATATATPTAMGHYEAPREKFVEYGVDPSAILTALEECVQPACSRLAAFVEADYLPHARMDGGVWAWGPVGEEAYRCAMRFWTSTDITPAEVHELGLAEVAAIEQQMLALREPLGYGECSLQQLCDAMKADPKYAPPTPDAIISGYTDVITRAKALAPNFFTLMPKAECVVKPIEATLQAGAIVAYYQQPPADGSRPGVFYANTYDHTGRPTYNQESIGLHEAIPGHHFQIALAQELPGLPRCRSLCPTFMAYCEGWGLYCEKLGKEMGFYTDPAMEFGRLVNELMRACRLVVDTGLHAYRWSFEQAVAYYQQHLAMGATDITNEIRRYCVNPAQACSYKIGERMILKLRARAEAALGAAFDIKQFHAVVLGSGTVPLSTLEALVDQWLATAH